MSDKPQEDVEGLIKWDAMKYAVAECHTVDEVAQLRNKANAYRYALIQAKESPEVIRQAEEIKLRAERRAGELLKDNPSSLKRGPKPSLEVNVPGFVKFRDPGALNLTNQETSGEAEVNTSPIEDIGISTKQSLRWRKIAEIPKDEFENFLSVQKELTTQGILRYKNTIDMREQRVERVKSLSVATDMGTLEQVPVTYADPPWRYEHVKTESRAIENQ